MENVDSSGPASIRQLAMAYRPTCLDVVAGTTRATGGQGVKGSWVRIPPSRHGSEFLQVRALQALLKWMINTRLWISKTVLAFTRCQRVISRRSRLAAHLSRSGKVWMGTWRVAAVARRSLEPLTRPERSAHARTRTPGHLLQRIVKLRYSPLALIGKPEIAYRSSAAKDGSAFMVAGWVALT
jgi:hypothetical protein